MAKRRSRRRKWLRHSPRAHYAVGVGSWRAQRAAESMLAHGFAGSASWCKPAQKLLTHMLFSRRYISITSSARQQNIILHSPISYASESLSWCPAPKHLEVWKCAVSICAQTNVQSFGWDGKIWNSRAKQSPLFREYSCELVSHFICTWLQRSELEGNLRWR